MRWVRTAGELRTCPHARTLTKRKRSRHRRRVACAHAPRPADDDTGRGEWANPLRDPRDRRLPRIAGPSGLVIFGVTGDLSKKKLIPAVYDLSLIHISEPTRPY